ncbi:uncharacterized protein [Drosophila pseudoobscura]|uniref:Uncharacterized protein isoform X1 n=2 Tax=Drosophila pseudoobscura pseudoobscura TaxID=46245 RepID=A0A6I8WA87_DROPS|nr:uncharacterized protein LOC117184745 isoform X1 [Drosophila pseudoobscura]
MPTGDKKSRKKFKRFHPHPDMAPRIRASRTTESRRDRGINSYRCRVCRGIHPLRTCHHFLRLSPEKRLRAVLINKYCGNCLAHQHSGQDCRSGGLCRVCGKNHHTLLHIPSSRRPVRSASGASSPSTAPHVKRRPRRPARSASAASSPSTSAHADRRPRLPVSRPVAGPPAPSVDSLLQHRSLILLPTALVVLDTGSKNFETAALIDPCTPVSCIDDSLASAFKLPTTCVGDEKVCTAVIRAKMGDFQLETMLKVEPRVRIRTPIRQLSDSVRARFGDLRLADEQFHRPATISLILGADVYPKVIQPGFLAREDGLPVAQSTVFGWIVSGACTQP